MGYFGKIKKKVEKLLFGSFTLCVMWVCANKLNIETTELNNSETSYLKNETTEHNNEITTLNYTRTTELNNTQST